MKTKNFKKLLAFTLAEVLITLSILGVVAAITVPSLIKRQHRNEVETKLKKFVSTMQNAFEISIAENGPVASWTYDETSATQGDDVLYKYILPYLNIAEDHSSEENYGERRWKVTDPNSTSQTSWGYSRFCFKDGMCFRMGLQRSSGYISPLSYGEVMSMGVDINGSKGPNVLGKDVFMLSMSQDQTSSVENFQIYGLYHNHSSYSNYVQRCKSGEGALCGEWIARNNWKIPKDYPWL